MKERAPRNRTLTLEETELCRLDRDILTLNQRVTSEEIKNQVIHQDCVEALKLLPDHFTSLIVVDPPYNLTKQYGDTKFSKTTAEEYETWLNLWIPELKRLLTNEGSIYVCCDWQCSKSIQQELEKHFYIRNRITWEREKGRGAKSNWKNNSEDIWFCTVSKDYVFNVEDVKLKKRVIAPYRHEDRCAKRLGREYRGEL